MLLPGRHAARETRTGESGPPRRDTEGSAFIYTHERERSGASATDETRGAPQGLRAVQPGDDRPQASRTVAGGHLVGAGSQGRLGSRHRLSAKAGRAHTLGFHLIRHPENPQ